MLPPISQTNAELEPQVYREAMARLSAAVNVVTTAGPAGRSGFTATAVCSISDEPPFLLVCLNRASKTAPIVGENKVICVNVLCAHESELADVFAGRTGVHLEDRFSMGVWGVLKTGAPALLSARVSFDCRVSEIRTVASHLVLFGEVKAVRLGGTGPGLVYQDRTYRTL